MGEAVYLHKPMLAVPLRRQFEQVLNARYLAVEGYGGECEQLEDPDTVHRFLEALPKYEQRLSAYSQDGNREILHAIDRWLEKGPMGL